MKPNVSLCSTGHRKGFRAPSTAALLEERREGGGRAGLRPGSACTQGLRLDDQCEPRRPIHTWLSTLTAPAGHYPRVAGCFPEERTFFACSNLTLAFQGVRVCPFLASGDGWTRSPLVRLWGSTLRPEALRVTERPSPLHRPPSGRSDRRLPSSAQTHPQQVLPSE